MAVDISTLTIELTTGSFASAYSAAVASGNVNFLVDVLNRVSAVDPFAVITVGRANAAYLQQQVVGSEYIGLTQAQRDLWGVLLGTAGANGLPISNTLIRGQVTAVWSAATTTRSNLVSAQTRPCSRGEFLFGENTFVDGNLIYVALHTA
jgi:hypothetical protein